jgi:hypothetical protein
VLALLDDAPGVHDQDAVGVDDGGQPMGDDQRGVVLRHLRQGLLDGLLGVAVQRRGGLVEDHDARALEDGPGDGDALLLAAGELEPALADQRVPAVRQALDEGADVRQLGGALELFAARLRGARRRGCSRCCR